MPLEIIIQGDIGILSSVLFFRRDNYNRSYILQVSLDSFESVIVKHDFDLSC